tara:strand:- start:26 stop:286 length:261 start_codon:yes stop_codon:yes gene_type:complete
MPLIGVILLKKIFIIVLLTLSFSSIAAPPKKSKFYDFGDQMIDGEIKKPTGQYINSRDRARFDRLLSLKKSFLPKMFLTSKEKIFK